LSWVQNKYERHLLAFEREISRDAPRRPVYSEWGKVAEEQRAIKKMREERHHAAGPAGRLGKKRIRPPKPKVGLALTSLSAAGTGTHAGTVLV
jgi:hypothetical protein